MTAEGTAAEASRLDFTELVREHQAMVFSIAYHFLHDRALAEELAQDVFLQLHRRLPKIESAEHVVFWLRKVASHRAIDCSRRRKYEPRVALEDVPEPATPIDSGDFMLSEKLRLLVGSLPEKLRIAVILRYQEELEPAEIARVLGVPARTVKGHLMQAIALLREKLAHTMKGKI
jgi:RNA polymerase sigma-70 factor (ECF subfamily)